MTCKKCKSENVSAQIVSTTTSKDKKKGILWWCFVGFWLVPVKWMFFTLPALFMKIFGRKKQVVTTKHSTVFLCQNCGYTWTK